MIDAPHLLWSDTGLEHRRCERSASALVAVQRALREADSLPGAPEFLQLYRVAERAEAAHFTRVWRDPAAYHWVRRAVHLLAACRGAPLPPSERAFCTALGAEDPEDALAPHLRGFGKFVLGLGLVSGQDVELAAPYEVELPHAIPGSELAIAGRGRVRIHGVSLGCIGVTHGGARLRLSPVDDAAAEGPRLETCPSLSLGAVRVALNPYVFHLPGLALFRGLGGATAAFQQRHVELAAEALRILRRLQPSSFDRFADAVRIVALKPTREEDFGTLSASELPGAFVCSVPADPVALAADFVHELHHGRLFSIEELGPFFDSGTEDAVESENHYSPWRDAPRPLHGLLHAVYVYLPVFHFWSAAYREGVLGPAQRAFARDQLARIPFQLGIGVKQLRRHARFTALGSALFEEMAREAAPMEAEAASLGATLDAPACTCRASGAFLPVTRSGDATPLSVGETLLDHIARYDRRGECAGETEMVGARGRGPGTGIGRPKTSP